jgi:hypothetical protein
MDLSFGGVKFGEESFVAYDKRSVFTDLHETRY